MCATDSVETFAFQAEINQLLSLIIHTFYSNKDIFLRELVANASDALDKIRYQSLTQSDALAANGQLQIKIVPDKEAKTLAILDSGIGMTKQDLIANLGTIARSGTKAFMESLLSKDSGSGGESKQNTQLIGQFGVGFYAAYLVADTVRVISKHNDDSQTWVWESSAGGSFTVQAATAEEAACIEGRGTCIFLHLKEDQQQYLEESRLRAIVKQHCEFIGYPICLKTLQEKEVPIEEEERTKANAKDAKADEEAADTEDAEDKVEDANADASDKEEEPKTKTKTETVVEWLTLNKQKPIWMKPAEEVTQEEYASFYKSLSNDWEDHLAVKHFAVEGQLTFRSILYVPKRPPFDLFGGGAGKTSKGNIKLYVRRVFITDTATLMPSDGESSRADGSSPDASLLMPEYLNFIKGVVDSEDLPLNISREMLQQNKVLRVIKKNLVKKTLDMLMDLQENKPDDYKTFYENFSKCIKLGVHEDDVNREKLQNMLYFPTNKGEHVALKTYVERMKPNQTSIYYITGESRKAVERSPFIEKLNRRGYEVLFMVDPIDEYMMQRMRDYDGKTFVCCTKEGFKIEEADSDASGENAEAEKQKASAFETGLCKRMKELLGERVTKVVVSDRIVDAPCVLVTEQYSWSANMERIMKAQALQSGGAMNPFAMMGSRKILEINPDHPLMAHMQKLVTSSADSNSNTNTDASSNMLTNLVELVYESTLIHSGFSIEDPARYTDRVFKMVQAGLGIDMGTDDDADNNTEKEGEKTETGTQTSLMEELD